MKRTAALAILALLCAATAAVTLAQGDDAPDYDDDYADPPGGDYGDEGDEGGDLSMPAGPEAVVDLTSADVETFDTEYMKEHRMVMLEMYAPWCGHCKAFAPHYETAARTLKETFPNVTIAKVDATVNEAMGEKFNIEGYPTVKWIEYVEGGAPKVSDFQAAPDADAIVNFVKKRAGSAVTLLPSDAVEAAAALTAALASNPAVVVAFFPAAAPAAAPDSDAFKLFAEAARQVDGVQWTYTTDPKVLAAAVAAAVLGDAAEAFSAAAKNAVPVIAVVRPGPAGGTPSPPTAVRFAGTLDDDTKPLVDFVKLERLPNVVPFTDANIEMIFESSIKTQVLFFGNPEQQAAAADFFGKVADKYRGEYLFVSVNMDGSENAMGVAEYFGVVPESDQDEEEEEEEEEDPLDDAEATGGGASKKGKRPLDDFKPVVFLFYAPDEVDPEADEVEEGEEEGATPPLSPVVPETPQKWKLEEDFTESSLEKFLEAHKAGTLKPHFKSEDVPPEGEQKGPVLVVVGKNFDDVVMDPTKDVLLEVYAPWCQHCKALEPIYEKLARRFLSVESMVIAKMDGTKNEHPQVADVEGFPAIFFFPAGADEADKKKTRVPYPEDQPRTLPGFTKWLKNNAKVPYELKKKVAGTSKVGQELAGDSSETKKDEL